MSQQSARGGQKTGPGAQEIAAGMIARADAARDARLHRDAALLYSEALRLDPDNAGIRIQCGHMYKEMGDYAEAQTHYAEAARITPDDPDLALQFGHFYKVTGRLKLARDAYRRALDLKPGWTEPLREIEALAAGGWRESGGDQATAAAAPDEAAQTRPSAPWHLGDEAARLSQSGEVDTLAIEVAPRRSEALFRSYHEHIDLRRCGLWERSAWGMIRTLRGVEAVRGFCVSNVPIVEMQIAFNGLMIYRGPLRGGYVLDGEREVSRLRKYVFNVWLDFSGFSYGRYGMDVRFVDASGNTRTHHEGMAVAAPRLEEEFPASDAFVSIAVDDPRPVEEQVNSRPSMVRDAVRQLFTRPIRTVLVQRVDQLGDMVCSVPAIRRLRTVFPEARLVGLLSPANRELAASLELFDDIVVTDFPDVWAERRRIMPIEQQTALRETLSRFDIDLAIDLSDSGVSRPLLFLSDAPYRYGFRYAEFPWMIAGFEGGTHDIGNGNERVPHTAKVMGLIEWLAVLAKSHARIEPRPGLSRTLLTPFGLGPDDRYVVMHTGARLAFSRWPHYRALAAMVLARTSLKVVMLTDDPGDRATLPPDLAASDRFTLVDQRPSFDAFDALVSFCSAFVGNDSGPKHLASLRGAGVVSLHMARNNWNEWGQENRGYIISRKVPCAGCSIHHEPEECGKDFVCIANITAEEVFGAVTKLL